MSFTFCNPHHHHKDIASWAAEGEAFHNIPLPMEVRKLCLLPLLYLPTSYGPLLVFVNKVLLENSHAHFLHIVSGSLCATTVMLHTCNRGLHSLKIFTIWPFAENLCCAPAYSITWWVSVPRVQGTDRKDFSPHLFLSEHSKTLGVEIRVEGSIV